MSCPSNSIVPVPFNRRSNAYPKVDLPDPLSPTTPTVCPALISTSIPSTALIQSVTLPKKDFFAGKWTFTFDPEIISYNKIIEYFFEIHDPTTLNLQGPDRGTQYRSEIFYLNESQKKIAEEIINLENKKLSGKVVTKLSILKNYCPAEEYHQKYLEKR